MGVFITRVHEPEEIKDCKELMPCPLCGSKAFLSKDIVDGFYFGWSVGCPRACINDRTHKLGEKEFKKARLTFFGLDSKERAIKIWNKRCEEGVTADETNKV